MQLEITSEMAQGIYSNFAVISHSRAEFIVDLCSALPGTGKTQVVSRAVMVPENAKRLAMALHENIVRYEREFGPIRIDEDVPEQKPRTATPFGGQGEA